MANIWIEGHARAFDIDETGFYLEDDTLKWGIETVFNVIDIRDSLLYVLINFGIKSKNPQSRYDLFNFGGPPTTKPRSGEMICVGIKWVSSLLEETFC